jgi:hypothetical protein
MNSTNQKSEPEEKNNETPPVVNDVELEKLAGKIKTFVMSE